jgi:spore coat polysaccharide biosynthesis protein SpsF
MSPGRRQHAAGYDKNSLRLFRSCRLAVGQAIDRWDTAIWWKESGDRMIKTLGIVEVPWQTAGLKDGFRRRLGGKTLVEWVARRVSDCQRLDGVILLVGDSEVDRQIAELAPTDVPVFTSRQSDPLGRYAAAIDEYTPESIVRVTADTPFVDAGLIDRLVTTADSHAECDYISYCCRDGQPAMLSPIGVHGEWVRAKTLRQAARRATDPVDRKLVTRYIYSHPEDYCVRLIPAPHQLDRDDVRLAMEGEDDWEHTQDIFDALGPDVDWQRIAGLLDHQPGLRSRMATLNRTLGVR